MMPPADNPIPSVVTRALAVQCRAEAGAIRDPRQVGWSTWSQMQAKWPVLWCGASS